MRTILVAKVKGVVTGIAPDYEGSLTLGEALFKQGDFEEGEQVTVINENNGTSLVTYLIKGKDNQLILNGAAARMGLSGDTVSILAYGIK